MKKIVSILLCLLLCLGVTACATTPSVSSTPEEEKINLKDISCNIYAINGPTGIGMASLKEIADKGEGRLKYTVNLAGANDEIVAKISNGEADIATVATNVSSLLYNKTSGNITVLAVNTLGVLSLIAKGEEIKSIADLKGKTVYTTGQGANPEFISKYILEKNGLTVGTDITLEFVSQPQELVQKVVPNEKAIVIAPQPVATAITVKDQNAKIVFDLNDEWDKVSDTKLVMGCVIVRNEYLKENPEAVKQFMKDYEASIKAVNSDTDRIASLSESYGIITPAAVVKKAVPYCNIVFESGNEMKTNLSAYLKFLFDNNPQLIGGKLPADSFYYNAK